MLIQLPNGDWVAPPNVAAVRVHSDIGLDNSIHFQVAVDMEFGRPSWVFAESWSGAETIRDRIAEQVNRALYKPEGTP